MTRSFIQKLLIFGAALLSLSCADNRRRIAIETIVDQGQFLEQAYQGALRGRFPPGSGLHEFLGHMEEMGARCRPMEDPPYRCTLTLRAMICAAELAFIDAYVAEDSGKLERIDVEIMGVGC